MTEEPPAGVPAERRLRAMTFNVRYDTEADGDHAWDRRKEMVASVVRFHRPDVVGLQEPLAHQVEYLREHLPGYEWVAESRRAEESVGEHCPVGYRRARFERLDWGSFWLSETPEKPGSVGWDAQLPRLATWVELRDDRTDRRWYAVNTHFDHRGERARLESARLLRDRLGAFDDAPTVVTGDFNLTEGDDPYDVLTDERDPALRDARYAATHPHHGPSTTFNLFEGDPDRKIDYVFVTDGVAVHQHAVVADHWDERVPSDHRPVIAELSIE